MTVIASLNEEVERESYHVRDVLNDLNMDANGSDKKEEDVAIDEVINISSNNSAIESNSKSTEESTSDRGKNPEMEAGSESTDGATTLPENALQISDKNDSLNSSSVPDTPVALADKEKDSTVDRNSNQNGEKLQETIDSPHNLNPTTDTSTKLGDRNDAIQANTAEAVGESAESNPTPVSTTDNLIALCETMSTIPSTDSIFQEVVQFMRASDSEVSQQQKDDTAASISVALKSLLGIGGELRTLPLAQPKILLAAVSVVKGIFSPLIKSLTSPDSAVKDSSTVPETESSTISSTTPSSEGPSQIKTESSDGIAQSERIIVTNETSSNLTSAGSPEISASNAVEDIGDLRKTTDIVDASIDRPKAEYITMDVGSNHSLIEINSSIACSEETETVIVPLDEAAKNLTVSDVNISGMISLIQNLSAPASQAPSVVKLINMSAVTSADTDEVNYIQQENAAPSEEAIGDSIAKIELNPLSDHESINTATELSKSALIKFVDADSLSIVHRQVDSVVQNVSSDGGISKVSESNATTTSNIAAHTGNLTSSVAAAVNISSMGPLFEKSNVTCFETLNYTEFHSKMKTKLQNKSGTMRYCNKFAYSVAKMCSQINIYFVCIILLT